MASSYYEAQQDDEEPGEARLTYVELMQAENIVTLLPKEDLDEISSKVISEFDLDYTSLNEWRKKNEAAIKLATMVAEEKNTPYKNSSNVKYPLVARAALEFQARAYPAIVPPDRIVKGKTYGKDETGEKAARADRVSEHMSWQLSAQMPEWEEDTDRLTLVVSISGVAFRKVFYDPALKRNVTRLVTADRLVYNYHARSFTDLPRLTEILSLYPNEVKERINDGRFAEFDYDALGAGDVNPADEEAGSAEDGDNPLIFLEQHRLLDLDEDGYPEPYIVTVHKSSGKVCRIKANWTNKTAVLQQDGDKVKVVSLRKVNYFIRYLFLPSPDGGAYGLGFGWLLADTNEAINTTLNQMFDAGSLQNMQGGLISSTLGLREKSIRLERGEWRVVQTSGPINQAIMQIKYDGPSPVLFQLLGTLIESGKELAAIKDVLTGETSATAAVGTTQMLIEQGLTVFTSIYKRIHRALKAELRLLAKLNATNVTPEEYAKFHDMDGVDPAADYDDADMDILPVSDPQSVTKVQKIAKAQTIYGLAKENPTMDPAEATKRILEAIDAEDIEKLMPPPPQPDPAQAELAKRAATAQVESIEAANEDKIASATNKLAAAIKAIADAEGVEAGNQMGMYAQIVDMLRTEHKMEQDIAGQQQQAAGPGGVPGMEGAVGNQMGAAAAPVAGGAGNPGDAGGVAQPVDVPAAGMGSAPGVESVPQGAL